MDIRLFGINGVQLIRYLRKNTEHPDIHTIPTILGYTREEMKNDYYHFLRLSFDAYLEKPLKPEELLSVVEYLLKS